MTAGRRLELPDGAAERIAACLPFTFRHRLQGHPLLSIEALATLADRLPVDSALVERFGDASFVRPHETRAPGRPPPGDLIRDIETNGCWADLRHVDQVPAYRDLVEEVLATALTAVPRLERECIHREGFIFITAPGAVTPVHADPEHNFYLQVRGTKMIALAPLVSLDRAELAQWRGRRGYQGGYRRPLDTPARMESFTVEPGAGLYMPVYAIHAVRNTDAVSIALSVTCRTRGTLREYATHAIRGQLRRLRWYADRQARAGRVPSLNANAANSNAVKVP